MVDRDRQRLDDADQPVSSNKLPIRHRLFSAPPAYVGADVANYTAPAGYLIPLDLEGKAMNVYSYRADVIAPVNAAIVTGYYSLAIYEAEPLELGAHITSTRVNLRGLPNSLAFGSVVSNAVADAIFRRTHVLRATVALLPYKQYYLWIDADTAARFFSPSRLHTSFASSVGGLTGIYAPPANLLVNTPVASDRAPCVELRSRYGTLIFGDPAEVF